MNNIVRKRNTPSKTLILFPYELHNIHLNIILIFCDGILLIRVSFSYNSLLFFYKKIEALISNEMFVAFIFQKLRKLCLLWMAECKVLLRVVHQGGKIGSYMCCQFFFTSLSFFYKNITSLTIILLVIQSINP